MDEGFALAPLFRPSVGMILPVSGSSFPISVLFIADTSGSIAQVSAVGELEKIIPYGGGGTDFPVLWIINNNDIEPPFGKVSRI